MARMKDTEYGGADVTDTLGIQPAPHVLTSAEKLRLMYKQDPASPTPDVMPVGLDPVSSQIG